MKVTTDEIARAAGVSQATVSIVLNNNRKEGIYSKMEEAGLADRFLVLVDEEEENDNLDSTYEFDSGVLDSVSKDGQI